MALTLREQYIRLQREREEAAAEHAELKRKEAEEVRLQAEREELEITLSRCDDDEASSTAVLDEADAELAAAQERHDSLCAKVNQKLDAISACRDEAKQELDKISRSIERLHQIEASPSPVQQRQDGATTEAPSDGAPTMPAFQQHFLLETLTTLKRDKALKAFWFPVALSYNAPGYREVVERPMDLTTLECNLVLAKYATATELEADFDLIEANARLYNKNDLVITGAAERMQKKFRVLMEELPPNDTGFEDQSSVSDSEDHFAAHGLPNLLPVQGTEAAPDFDVPIRGSDGRLSGPQYARRRPTSTDKEWSVTPARWVDLSDHRKRILTHVGKIMETLDGELAAESCLQCTARGTECKVYKEAVRQQKFKGRITQGYGCGSCRYHHTLPCSLQAGADAANGIDVSGGTKKGTKAGARRAPLRPQSGNGRGSGIALAKRKREYTSFSLADADVDDEDENWKP
ncbi:hypothetical protein LTR95_012193 [Oleoguttula sp. CCFEE 5521]